MHGEHWVDLILAQGSSQEGRHLKAFSELAESLLISARAGRMTQVNEKVDGSPSIVVGFTSKNEPFVAYKGHFSKKTGQSLVTKDTNTDEVFKRSEGLKRIFSVLRDELGPALAEQLEIFRNSIFQGDLLFVEGDNRRIVEDDKVIIQANSITYEVPSSHPYFNDLQQARVGIVFHTVGERRINQDGTLSAETSAAENQLREFVLKLRRQNIFVIDPFKDSITIARSHPLTNNTESTVRLMLHDMKKRMQTLTPSFTQAWNSKYESLFRVFFNSGLRPPNTGGIYREVAEGKDIDIDKVILGFRIWTLSREDAGLQADFTTFAEKENTSLRALLQSYIDAIRIQSLLLPSLKEAFASKLGGGDSEGLMLKTSDTVVKLVDRLAFTLLNNQRWNRGGDIKPLENFPVPFNVWNPQAVYVVLKGQPVHGGHIEMIKTAVRNNPGKKVYVLLSNKEPNLEATEWRGLGISDTKKKLQEKEYTYIFSTEFRRKILEQGLKKLPVEILVQEPFTFWSHLRSAKAAGLEGQVQLIVGDKEIQEQRYALQQQELSTVFQLQSVDLQLNGISATRVRESLRKAVLGSEAEKSESFAMLSEVYGFIGNQVTRRRLINQMMKEWKMVDELATKLTTPPPKIKKPRVPRKKKTAA